jgi:hypothetical protein
MINFSITPRSLPLPPKIKPATTQVTAFDIKYIFDK